MLSISIRGIQKAMTGFEREKDRLMDEIAQDLLVTAKEKTPIDKGQARNGWRLENMLEGKRVVNRVPHIDYLENGRSKQAPRGILGPTMREISNRRYK